ncbi:unnamed protein product [Bursaphelenchus okinawaensis]|uniref:Dehydrogenase/reductase SDR family member 1 n=1 Tax=Bursaphelenchus okinawaensis TaxID=465554 RepID=A0A811K2J8_9BILA|nr:unnamed protein product [Bursaphelenchus okinawaensis]CAG9090338.1 unnamed protein product [Bursaphelenchus okinawaensis]
MSLSGKIALVTGASRGIGKGIAVELGAAGATVYVTGRSPDAALNFPNTTSLTEVADEITKKGGRGIVVYCDHSKSDDVKQLFERINKEQNGRLDVLINNAYAAVQYIGKNVDKKFFEYSDEPEYAWDVVNNVGLRNHYICSVYAARMMVKNKSGFICTVSSPGGIKHLFNIPYGVGKSACDRLAADMAFDLQDHRITSMALWPGAVKTEIIEQTILSGHGKTDPAIFEGGESIYFAGRCLAAIIPRQDSFNKYTGRIVLTDEIANEHNVIDADGTRPRNQYYTRQKQFADMINAVRTADIKKASI